MNRLLLGTAAMAVVTLFTRAAPFLFFSKRKPPAYLDFLQRYAPAAVMSLLVLSTFRSVDFGSAPHGLPALAGVAVTAALHLWKRNVLVSIAGGTALYMLLSGLL
ncbi:MAG TPA: branched-chain amino acid transporter AzlD [Spirochaetaceae bacterium]|jgi:branched-subunit amino acid transport protein AzlD|nr:branched-chain amino acid transporter AzlD [Spirochaetaceae bacterium]